MLKIAFSGDHVIAIDESRRIRVYLLCESPINALREIAAQHGFNRDPNWSQRQFACKLIDFLNQKNKQENDS